MEFIAIKRVVDNLFASIRTIDSELGRREELRNTAISGSKSGVPIGKS